MSYGVPKFHEKDYLRLRSQIRIDMMQIGEELVQLPSLTMEAGEHCAEALADRDVAQNDVKEATAVAANALRSEPNEAGKPPSAAQVTSELSGHPLVIKATRALEDAKLDAALWQTLVQAVQAKTSAMKRISELTVAGYLSPASMYHSARKETPTRAKLKGTT